MRKALGTAAVALLMVALLLATGLSSGSSQNGLTVEKTTAAASPSNIIPSGPLEETFTPAKQFQSGTVFDNQSYVLSVDRLSQDFAMGDLNNDGLSDAAVISKQPNEICIYNRSANGALSGNPWMLSKSDIVDMRSIVIYDLDGAGLNDIVVSYNDSLGNGHIAIFYQSASFPHFSPSTCVQLNVDAQPYDVVIGRYGGAVNCIATVCMGGSVDQDDNINIWRYPFSNPSTNFWRIPISIAGDPVFTKSQFLASGYVDGDDRMDLIVGNKSGTDVFIAIQPATWKTAWTTSLKTIAGSASDVQLADVNGDGRCDLIFADSSNSGGYSTLRIYPNDGNGFPTNPPHAPLKTPLGLGSVAVGNLSDDPTVDLVALSYAYANASTFFQDGVGFFGQYSNLTFPVDESPLKAIIDDSIAGHEGLFILCQGTSGENGSLTWFNANPRLTGNAGRNLFTASYKLTAIASDKLANGDTIMATVLTAANKVLLYNQRTNTTWTMQTQNGPVAVAFGRFSLTGVEDLAVLNAASHTISLYRGSQLFSGSQPYKNISLPFSDPLCMSAECLRGGEFDDLMVGYGQGCYILFNTGDGQPFNQTSSETLGGAIAGDRENIVVSDFNMDGDSSDIALLNTGMNKVEIYLRNLPGGPGSYYQHSPKTNLSTGSADLMRTIALGDLGGTAKDDIAAVTQNGRLLVFIQPSYGFDDTTFFPETSLSLRGRSSSLTIGDVNDDGLSDVLVGYSDSPRLAAYLRTGYGTFVNIFNLSTGSSPAGIMAQDVNGDGRTDIVCSSPGSHSVSIWFQHDLAPVAVMTAPSHQYRGQYASFSGASSLDSYSDIVTLNYTWNFGDGGTGYGRTVTHRYLDNLTYCVCLTVTDRGGLKSIDNRVIVIDQTYPSASCTIWPDSPSEGRWVSFNDTSQPSGVSHAAVSSWQWEFDGVHANGSQDAKQNFGAGEHTVRLTITDDDGISNSTLWSFHVTEAKPSAAFQSAINRVGSLSFFNSTGGLSWTPIVSYRWTFGDGSETNGTATGVTHAFMLKGWYRIVLNVTDEQGFTDEAAQWLYVQPTPPMVSLELNGPSSEGEVTRFTVTTESYNPVVSWNWSYDNNQTWHRYDNDIAGASFTFSENGDRWVSLNVTASDGSWRLVGMVVKVQESNPRILGFGASDGLTYDLDQEAGFWASAVSYKPITKYEWNFDYNTGGTWVASNPLATNHTSWTFTEPGIHWLKVRVWDDDGFSECSAYLEVQVKNLVPVAHFSSQNSTRNSGEVLFDATLSTDTPSDIASLTYGWNFGDQGGWTAFSASNLIVSHEFASDGRYNITLMVRDQWGSGSALEQRIVLVDRTSPTVVLESTGANATAGQAITIMAKVTDLFGVRNVTLLYRINNGNELSIAMTPMNGPNTFYGQIPAQASDTNVSYSIIAIDENNNPYSTQTYQLNIKAAAPLGISAEQLAILTAVALIISVLILLVYRSLVPVDEVFIIFQDGQLMAHQTRRIKPGMDDDILASMFVAIQMFVKDSFKDESSTGLNRLDFGEKKILVEKGESFYLAVVLHSNRTGSVPGRMQSVIDDIQTNFGPALKGWNGDLEKVRGIKDAVDPLVRRSGPFGKG